MRGSQAPRRARAARPGGVRAPLPGRGLRGAGARRLVTSREVQLTWTRALGGPAPPSADSFSPSGWNKLKTPIPAPSGPLAPSRPCPAFHSPYQGETRPPGARVSAPREPECRRPRRHSQPCALRGHLPQTQQNRRLPRCVQKRTVGGARSDCVPAWEGAPGPLRRLPYCVRAWEGAPGAPRRCPYCVPVWEGGVPRLPRRCPYCVQPGEGAPGQPWQSPCPPGLGWRGHGEMYK